MAKATAAAPLSQAFSDELSQLTEDDDDLDAEELRRLNDALDEAEAQYQRGEYVPAEVVLQELRDRASRR
jgi:hypothetical protein